MENYKLIVVIVLYYPCEKQLLDLISICRKYFYLKILFFDNTPICYPLNIKFSNKIIYFKSKKIVGIGGAHYYAAQMAVKEKFDFIIFLDQDSYLPNSFIQDMLAEFKKFKKIYPHLAAIGPNWHDYRRPKKNKKEDLNKPVTMLISSGTLIAVSAMQDIGFPKKEYFIDHIDTEWCFRAINKGYDLVKVSNVSMAHEIGEVKTVGRWFLQYHKPNRYYYCIRNSFFIFSEKWIPLSSRIYILVRNLFEIIKIPFLPKPLSTCYAVWQGLKDGIRFKKL
ncbi:MAG: glycosyltransferase [Rickettsiella sp.]|nr:glycosyltransferase [Rickettsiella sp.]